MLYLLDENVRTVKWNGIPLHEASSAIVKEETNGDFYLTVRYPITDTGIYQLIKEDMLIKAPTPVLGAQLFRIKKPIENDDSIDITAYHVTYDIMQRSITPISVVGQGCAMALSQMVQNAKTGLGDFSFTSDITDNRTFNTTETETLYSVLMDGKHSIVGTWEGELVRDNFALSIKRSRGANRGVVITTHKNLKSYQRTKNSQGVVTRIHARSTFKPEGAEDDVTLTVTVDSPLINAYPYINEKEYENNNAKTVDDLKKWAEAKFKNDGIDKVSDAIEIEAYELDGQVVHLGDTVNLKSRKHNVDVYKKAIAYEYNALTEEYISITFDDKAGVGGSRVSSGLSSAADAILGASATAQNVAVERAVKNANQAFDAEFEKRVEAINDGIEQVKVKAAEYADRLNQAVTSKVQEVNQLVIANRAEQDKQYKETLAKASASSDLAKQAQNLATQVRDDLNKVKQTATQAQSQVNSQIELVKKDVGAIRNQQTAYEQTNTQNLARITGQLGDKASKAEVKQEAGKIHEEISQISIGGRNLIRGTKAMTIASGTWASGTFRASGAGTVKTIDVTDSPVTGFNKAIRLTSSDASKQIGIAQDGFDMPSGTYTMSCWIKGKAGQSVRVQVNADLFPLEIRLTKTGWQRVTYTATKSTTGKDSISYVFLIHGAAGDYIDVLAPQLESGTLATANVEALEDADEQITAARTMFERTAEGLKTDMVAVKSYVANDGKRKEELEKYSREETAKQIAAERIKTAENYVGKSQYTEDVESVNRRFEELTVGGVNLIRGAKSMILASGKWNTGTFRQSGVGAVKSIDVTDSPVSGFNKGVRLTANGVSNVQIGITQDEFDCPANTYTISWWVKGKKGQKVRIQSYWWTDDDTGISPIMVLQDSNWTRIKFTAKRSKSGKASIGYVYLMNGAKGDYLDVMAPQLEIGTFATANTEAPEDTQTKLAEYKHDVDGRFATITNQLNNKANQTDFQKVQETTKLYERIIGSTENDVASKVSKMVMSNSLFQVEVSKNEGLKTVQTQLAGSWAVQNINSAGDLISGLNLGANGVNRLDGRLTHITGQTLIDNAVIKSAMIDKLKTANFESGSVTTQILASGAVTADKLVVDQAFFNKLTSNEAYLKQLFAKQAFIAQVQSVDLSATSIKTGVLNANLITAGNLDASKVKILNLDVKNLVGDVAKFVKTAWESQYSNLTINGEELSFGNSWSRVGFTNLSPGGLFFSSDGHKAAMAPDGNGGVLVRMDNRGKFRIGYGEDMGFNAPLIEIDRDSARIGTSDSYIYISNSKIWIVKNNSVIKEY